MGQDSENRAGRQVEHPDHYYPGAQLVNAAGWGSAPHVLRALLGGDPEQAHIDWHALLGAKRNEGILNDIAYRARMAGHTLPEDLEQLLKYSLAIGEADKLSGDIELCRIFSAASDAGLDLLLMKGEALARTVYPSGTCRPSGDFDLLMSPAQLALGNEVMTTLGYTAGKFEGLHMFGQRTWSTRSQHQQRPYVVDLHWDLSNRRYFRNRISFETLYSAALEVPVPGGAIRVPSTAHALLIACIHLAAAEPDMPVDLRWLLDIRLLLNLLEDTEFEGLLQEARQSGLRDAMIHYCKLADTVLGPCRHRQTVIALASQIDAAERLKYRRSCEQRWYDLVEYGSRLEGWKLKTALVAEAIPYVLRRLGRSGAEFNQNR